MNLVNRLRRFFQRAPAHKEDWEFEWQRDNWVNLFQQQSVQDKCQEYWYRYRHLNDILGILRLNDQSRILDVGCGISTVLHYLPGVRYGIDPLGERYKTIYRYPLGIEIRAGHGENLPFEDSSFDAVFSSNCIDHTEHPVETIHQIQRILKPNGFFVLTCEVFAQNLGARNEGHPHSLTADSLLQLASPFDLVQHWRSPWIGLRNYVLGEPPTSQEEHILLLQPRQNANVMEQNTT